MACGLGRKAAVGTQLARNFRLGTSGSVTPVTRLTLQLFPARRNHCKSLGKRALLPEMVWHVECTPAQA